MFASYVPRNAFSAWHDPSYDVIGQMLEGKIFQKNHRGLHLAPVPARVNVSVEKPAAGRHLDDRIWNG